MEERDQAQVNQFSFFRLEQAAVSFSLGLWCIGSVPLSDALFIIQHKPVDISNTLTMKSLNIER